MWVSIGSTSTPFLWLSIAGRSGNTWESPDGCLMFSAVQRLAIPGQRLPFVQYIVSLAVVQAVQAEAAARLQVGLGGARGCAHGWREAQHSCLLVAAGLACAALAPPFLFASALLPG